MPVISPSHPGTPVNVVRLASFLPPITYAKHLKAFNIQPPSRSIRTTSASQNNHHGVDVEVDISLLPVAGALCLMAVLIEGWVMALIRYLNIKSMKTLFPGYRYLVRSHVDYALMAALLFVAYLVLKNLGLSPSKLTIAALILGALYNPFGFLLQAVKPELTESASKPLKVGILLGFIPATYGFGSVCTLIVAKLITAPPF